MLLSSVPVATAIGALDQKYCTCLFKNLHPDSHERHCGSLQQKEEKISQPENFQGQNYLRRQEFSQVVGGMPGIKNQIGLLCPPKEEIEVAEVDTQEYQDSIDGVPKLTSNSALGGANVSPMA